MHIEGLKCYFLVSQIFVTLQKSIASQNLELDGKLPLGIPVYTYVATSTASESMEGDL